jgi:hypothetical protein
MGGRRQLGVGTGILIAVLVGLYFAYEYFGPHWDQYRAPSKFQPVLERLPSHGEHADVLRRYADSLHAVVAPECWETRRVRRVTNRTANRTKRVFNQSKYNLMMIDGMIGLAQQEERTDLYAELLDLSIELRR